MDQINVLALLDTLELNVNFKFVSEETLLIHKFAMEEVLVLLQKHVNVTLDCINQISVMSSSIHSDSLMIGLN